MLAKPLLLATCLLAATFVSEAQTAPSPAATALTREMADRFQLNEGQYVRLLSINRTKLARQHEIEQATAAHSAARTTQLAELQGQYERECSRILSPTQLSMMQQDNAPQPTGIANGNG